MIRYKDNARAVAADVIGAAQRARDISPVLEGLGDRMVEHSIPQTFRVGGRPQRWPGTRRGGELQRDTGRLLNSIEWERTGRTLKVGTNLRYAQQRHEGGTIKAGPKLLAVPLEAGSRRRPRHFKLRFLPLKRPGNAVGLLVDTSKRNQGRARFVLMRQVTQPARPFLLFQAEDIAWTEREMVRHVTGEAG